MEYILDLQGFQKSTNSFVVKEAAYVSLHEEDSPTVLLFQPPCLWSDLTKEEQNINRWLESNYHGISWENGDIPYHHLIDVLQNSLSSASKIYVKGLEKKKLMQEIMHGIDVCDIEDLGCYSLKQLNGDNIRPCNHHALCGLAMCAEKNVKGLRNSLLQQQLNAVQDDYDNEYIHPRMRYYMDVK